MQNGDTHKALSTWMTANIKENDFQFYIRARENYLSESFHSLINKYTMKHIHYPKSYDARVACVAFNWNENQGRECLKILKIKPLRIQNVNERQQRKFILKRHLNGKILFKKII